MQRCQYSTVYVLYAYKIFYIRHWEGELEGLRTTQQRVAAQHLGHQWYNEDLLKQRPVTSPLIPSKFDFFTQLTLPVMYVFSSIIKYCVYLYVLYLLYLWLLVLSSSQNNWLVFTILTVNS